MEPENYSTAYLLNDDQNGFLLNGSEVGIHDNFVEHIFTQVEDTSADWRNDNFPVLLSNSLVTEDNIEYDQTTINETNIQLFSQVEIANEKSDDCTVSPDNGKSPESNTIITNDLVLSNDVLLQINNNDVSMTERGNNQVQIIQTEDVDNTTYITYTPVVTPKHQNQQLTNINGNLIQLVDDQGNVIPLSMYVSNQNAQKQQKKSNEINFKEFYNEINAVKCKICDFICEQVHDMKVHVMEKHADKIKIPEKTPSNVIKKPITKMTSILNTNNNENKKTMFLCSVCNNSYPDKQELKEHMINDHKLKSNKDETSVSKDDAENSSIDKTNVKSIRSLSEVLVKKQQKALKRVKCTVKGCNAKFAKDEQRKKHEECHVGDNKNQFKCPECSETFSMWRICNSHLWKSHKIDMGLLNCPLCNDFKSTSSVILLHHMAIHNDEKPFLCSECGKCFKQLTQLKNHEHIHKRDKETVPQWSSMKQCEICDRYFANSKSHRKHILFVHEKFKPFICNICGHKTARKAMLQLHIRQHTGAKPHHCPQCDYKTGDHNSLRRHIMRHVGVAKYSCPYCNYTSIQSTAYKNHITHRHPGKSGSYQCTYCSYSTVNYAAFASHVKCHQVALKNTANKDDNILLKDAPGNEQNTLNSINEPDNTNLDIEDDETQNCFLNIDSTDDTIDTGGITIPAGFELQLQVTT